MCTLPSTATLKAGRRHLEQRLEEARKNPALYAADALAYEIALDAIDYSLENQELARQRDKANREVDLAIIRIMDRSRYR